MVLLTDEENKSYHKQNICYICKKKCSTDNKKYHKVWDHSHFTEKYRGAAHNTYNLRYKAPKEILVLFHVSTYDYYFIIKKLPEEFDRQFKCLRENTEKYITSSISIKNDKRNTYKIKFINSFRFMSTSLSSLVDNLSEGLHNNKCTNYKFYLDYMSTKDDQLMFRCFKCKKKKKNYKKDFNKDLIKIFASK